MILDDLVLNVEDFFLYHPGGKFLLQQTLGRDISKYFYGGYSLEPQTVSPHRHSDQARQIVNSLTVARLAHGKVEEVPKFQAKLVAKE